MSMPFDVLPSKLRITSPCAGQTSDMAGALAGAGSGAASRLADGAGAGREAPAEATAVPAGGATRSTWPTSIASALDKPFQRAMFCTEVRFARAIFDTVSPRSTR